VLASCSQTNAPIEVNTSETDGVSEEPELANSSDPIKIGFEGWSSGPDALYGLVPQYLLEDYVDNVNENGGWLGREVQLISYDISGQGGDFSEAVNATNKLIQEDVVAIIGPSNSSQGVMAAEICDREKMLLFPVSSAQSVTVDENGDVRPYVFRTRPVITDSAKVFAHYVFDELNAPVVAILYETTLIDTVAYRDVFKETYEQLGGIIVDEATYQVEDFEFRAQLTKLAQSNPDYIYMPAMAYKEVGNVAKQLTELGFGDEIKILGTQIMDATELLDIAGNELEGAIYILEGNISDPKYDEMIETYYENHSDSGIEINFAGFGQRNAIQILEQAILTTQSTDRDVLRDYIENELGTLELTTGTMTGYEKDTHNIQGLEFYIKTIENGEFVELGKYSIQD